MKKVILFLLVAVMYACTDESAETKAKSYYLNEDFILVDKKEDIANMNDNLVKVRTWIIQRVNSPIDSVMVAEISSQIGNCEGFSITNQLWYNKQVGDVLHFEFIRKDRFFTVRKDYLNNTIVPVPVVSTPVISTPEPQVGSVENDRKILELERQQIRIQTELDKLKAIK